jgi:hypothetical protein
MKITLYLLLICFVTCASGNDRAPTDADLEWYDNWQQTMHTWVNLDEYARAAVALDTNAAFGNRYDAIESLSNNPTAHLDALEALLKETDWALRYAAINVIEPVRPDLAYQAAKQLVLEATQATAPADTSWALRAAALMAQMGDGFAISFIIQQIYESPFCSDRNTAIRSLRSFFYLKDMKPFEPLIRFIDMSLPNLYSVDAKKQRDAISSLSAAISVLAQLHAVEALPEFSRWLAAPVPDEIHREFESAQRELNALKTRMENGEPDLRDNPEYKRTPGATPAWRFPIKGS